MSDQRPLPQANDYSAQSDKARAASTRRPSNPPGANVGPTTPVEPAADRPSLSLSKKPKSAKKRGIGSKFREAFTGDDAQSVGAYLTFEVAIPAFKRLIFEMVNQGTDRILFGVTGQRGYSAAPRPGVNYGNRYNGGASQAQNPVYVQRELSQRARATHNFDREIIFATYQEANEVLDSLLAYLDEYHMVTVADLYQALEISPTHTDSGFGWTNLSTAGVRPVHNGFQLDLPMTVAFGN